jgi:Leucine-rich repeat (LRR) protein
MKTKIVSLLSALCLLFSCQNNREQKAGEEKELPRLSKLERLMLLPADSVIEHYDLSGDSLDVFPDLSAYAIKSLDVSHNRLDTLIADYLPKEIRVLDLSHNQLKYLYNNGDFSLDTISLPAKLSKLDLSHNQLSELFRIWDEKEAPSLSELNLSNNRLMIVIVQSPVRKIDVSNNELIVFGVNDENLEYLNVSDNPQLSNQVYFDPSKVDTVIHNNIANDKPLEKVLPPSPLPLKTSEVSDSVGIFFL